nr:VC1465 family Xer recombination activation factor [Rhodoferax fermentans]
MRATLGERFKILLADAGLTPEQAGKELHVTPRTIRYWISGKVLVPYAAFRLIRILRMYELPQPGWDGWRMHSGWLWSPEGFSFKPDDANWWYLLVRRAEGFTRQYNRANELQRALQRGADGVVAQPVATSNADAAGCAATSPTAAGGRAAQPPRLDLSLEHFGT